MLKQVETMRSVKKPFLLEVSTETARKVGGIYSVMRSKAPVTVSEYGKRYLMVGVFDSRSADVEVEVLEPKQPQIKEALDSMRSRGIKVHYGRWLIDGAPKVVLFDLGSGYQWLDEWRADLWSIANIPSPPGDTETNDAIVFGYLTAWLTGEIVNNFKENAVILHCHEWLAGVALPLVRQRKLDCTTIFTTHATLLGRYLSAGNVDFYNNLQNFDVDAEAGKRGIYHRYCIERAAAHTCDVFTTVSDVTAYEAEFLLKRRPDGVLPNGLNVQKFNALHEFQNLHAICKDKIAEFVRGHFYGHFDFDLDNTLYFFISGRYEFRNKGADFFIESLARLNHRLKESGSKITVVAFIIMPTTHQSYTVESLKGQAVMHQLEDNVNEVQRRMGRRMFDYYSRASETDLRTTAPDLEHLLPPADLVLLKRSVLALRRHNLPPIVTHNVEDDSNDPVLTQIRRVQLFNHHTDRVKIIFHPEFINHNNPILSMDYDEFVRGCHLGVFPSYYEPWGYTPAECTVMGVPSITTNLSGFGCYIEGLIENSKDYGIYIVDRRNKGVDDSIEQLTDYMENFTKMTRRQRINQRNRTERLSDLLDWKRLGREYVKARSLALRTAYPSMFNDDDTNPFDDDSNTKITRPLSVPGSPLDASMLMTPGDLGTLQDANGALNSEEYFAFDLGEEEN